MYIIWCFDGKFKTFVLLLNAEHYVMSSTKTISITYSEYMLVALVIQEGKRMRRVILSSVTCLAVPHIFQPILINGTIFGKKSY